ncbi:putative V-type proton ATPase subunit D [Monocercomonoides exilis]|uniref:putative V-type proton ATPase subunit D n=1 Tax=Monocercomonoides exilis TaxID=2049356 RepID=UPI00355ABBA8|nr:putative V-type proton ATPase subunit D [Monocercomonoides exilis]|eukprot:MONOS_3441.1-p1 / transcript=MONOS_3441.1 / gene=MONOS_3441 / organism=Monocercomonoides_exilis_PA203 / gene_product=V-type proton ATPase subunit D / transcript_product=V-type proton ATPase subunit D / location=Mono_scaffold00081:58158-59242(+) / protein_length=258 / sequence_SO=supercontig / SO=protein_coding / is_pseudo=false
MTENIVPTRMVLQAQQAKMVAAKRGHELLKKKSDALSVKFRDILGKILDAKNELVTLVNEALFSTSHMKYTTGDQIKYAVRETVSSTTPTKVTMHMENLAGVLLPVFELQQEGSGGTELTGLAKGGKRVQECKDKHMAVVEQVVKLASLQTAFSALDEVIKVTNRRVNALEYVMIPQLEEIIHYIDSEMSEMEREEFFRLKMVQKGKKKKADEQEREQKQKEEELLAAGISVTSSSSSSSSEGAESLLTKDEDDDIVV